MKWRLLFLAGIGLSAFAGPLDDVGALGHLTNAPVVTPAKGYESSGNLKAIYFDALDWKGKPTKVFAWLGLPEKQQGKVSGIVLVHGGGLTVSSAFQEMLD